MTTFTIIVPTNRIGGLDVLLSGLANQSLPREEFELVLVDNLYARRKELVRQYAEEYGLRVKHLPPLNSRTYDGSANLATNGQYQRAINSALAVGTGRLTMILCDYTYLDPRCLETHAAFHDTPEPAGSKSLGGQVNCIDIRPIVHPDHPMKYGWFAPAMNHNPALYKDATFVPSYQPWMDKRRRLALIAEWSAAYMQDLETGLLDAFMYSTFGLPITPKTDVTQFRVWQRDKSETPKGQVHHQLCNLKQSSFSTEDLLKVNGMQEAMDGCHGHQDSELAGRLEYQLKTRFYLDHAALCWLFDPHGLSIVRDMQSPEDKNLGIYNHGHEHGFGGAVNDWSLRERREQAGKQCETCWDRLGKWLWNASTGQQRICPECIVDRFGEGMVEMNRAGTLVGNSP